MKTLEEWVDQLAARLKGQTDEVVRRLLLSEISEQLGIPHGALVDWRNCPDCHLMYPHPSVTSDLRCPSCRVKEEARLWRETLAGNRGCMSDHRVKEVGDAIEEAVKESIRISSLPKYEPPTFFSGK